MRQMTELERECARYLEDNEDARRIMEAILERYLSMSGVIGSARIQLPTRGEREFLRGLFKRDFSDQRIISVSLKKFEAAFIGTRFEGVKLSRVLEAYFNRPLRTNRLLQEQKQTLRDNYFSNLINTSLDEDVTNWLQESITEKSSGCCKFIASIYKQDAERLTKLLLDLNNTITLLKSSRERLLLPVAAALVTKDPHSLDEGTDLQKLLLYYLSFYYGIDYPKSSEDKTQLLYMGGILNDMGNRLVMTYGLEAYDNNYQAMGWNAFYTIKEPLVLTLLNLERIHRIEPTERASAKEVYSFENPSVFYSVIKSHPKSACICTSGQINTCAYRLMDLLAASDKKILYAGDFDPEGLLIADRLKNRYGDQVGFIGYTLENYHKSLSENVISESRVKQLDKLQDKALKEIAEEMQQIRRAGYQEYIIQELCSSMHTL